MKHVVRFVMDALSVCTEREPIGGFEKAQRVSAPPPFTGHWSLGYGGTIKFRRAKIRCLDFMRSPLTRNPTEDHASQTSRRASTDANSYVLQSSPTYHQDGTIREAAKLAQW